MAYKRDFHKLAIIKGEVRGHTSVVKSKKGYTRKAKHKGVYHE